MVSYMWFMWGMAAGALVCLLALIHTYPYRVCGHSKCCPVWEEK